MDETLLEQARERIAEEQAALRRVAVLVARGVQPEDVFAAVSEECGRVVGSESTGIFRYDDDETLTVIGRWGTKGATVFPVGMVLPRAGDTALTRVYETAAPARMDGYDGLEAEMAEDLRRAGVRSSVVAPIVVDGRIWGALAVGTFAGDPFPEDTAERLAAFAELVSLAIASTDARERLLDSRARLVQAGDAERRRLERDLHDGAQQRLVALTLALRLARAKIESDPAGVAPLLDTAIADVSQAVAELRELAHGLHPPLLTERGLAAALAAVGALFPIDVSLEVTDERLPETVEVAAYYVVAEALTNVAKHAEAERATVAVRPQAETLLVEVADDGRGAAELSGGSGLAGLRDRVEAIRGRLTVTSRRGAGTTVRAELPLPGGER